MTFRWWSRPPDEQHKRIYLVWGSTMKVNGAFMPDGLRGAGVDFLVLDEAALLSPNAWEEVFRPALTDRKGRVLFIGTPKGRNHFYDYFEYAKTDPDWEAFQFTTAQGGLVDAAELESVARNRNSAVYQQEYCAVFTGVGEHRVYYPFDRQVHVQTVGWLLGRPLVWSIDFNVNPMCMLLMQKDLDGTVYVLEEIVIRPDANTERACQAFLERAQFHNGNLPFNYRPLAIEVFGDSSGNQRRTAASSTDWTIIRRGFGMWRGTFEPRYFMANTNPLVRDRVNCVNNRLLNHVGETNLVVDPRCVELIKDLEEVTWALDKTGAAISELNKKDKERTHASDALGYYLSEMFPLKPQMGHQSAGFIV
jgi:hypothetical protein